MVSSISLLFFSVNHVKREVPSLIASSGIFEDEWCIFREIYCSPVEMGVAWGWIPGPDHSVALRITGLRARW